MLTARIIYPTFSERLACEPEALGLVTLREFSDFLPLGPGDQVLVNDAGEVTGIHELAPVFLIEAHFHMDTSDDLVLATAGEWDTATRVQKGTLTAFVASESRQWIEDVVRADPLVEFIEVRRTPGQTIDFEAALRDAL